MGTEVIAVEEDSAKKITDLEQKIIRQIEYYFGNYNLSRDKFLKEEIKNDDGWVALETMVKFNRLKQMTVDFNTISEALKKSPNQLMEVNEDCTKIRRRVPPSENVDKDELEERTLYVKGFKKDTKLDEILDFFKDNKVENIQMRKRKQGKNMVFKGSVFATFNTKEDCDAFLELKGTKFDKTELIKEKKKDYMKRKDIFYDNLRAEKAQKEAEKKAAGEKEVANVDITKGCLLKVSGLGEGVSRVDLKEAVEKLGKVAFVDYYNGDPDAVVRFDKAVVADILKEAEEEDGVKKFEISSVKATISLIEGEEEEKYWQKVARSKAHTRQKGKQHGNRGRFNKSHGNKRFRGRNRDDASEDQRPSKKVKAEEDASEDQPSNKRVKVEGGEGNKLDTSEYQPPSKRIKVEGGEENKTSEVAEKPASDKKAIKSE